MFLNTVINRVVRFCFNIVFKINIGILFKKNHAVKIHTVEYFFLNPELVNIFQFYRLNNNFQKYHLKQNFQNLELINNF